MGATSVVNRIRQPEYTGENRCIPCTITNTAIAAVLAVAIGYGMLAAGGDAVLAGTAGTGFFAVGLAAIYFRGYLVPYTPELTKRYFPDWVLAYFDKAPTEDVALAGSEAELDPEPVLLQAGVVEFCMGGEDLCPTEDFAAEWREEVQSLRENGLEVRIAEAVDADPETVSIIERTDFVLVRADGDPLARWESRAALHADMAALPALRSRVADWETLSHRDQGSLLNGVRVFLEECPSCDGEIQFSETTRESCCRSIDVITMECADCGERLLEVEA